MTGHTLEVLAARRQELSARIRQEATSAERTFREEYSGIIPEDRLTPDGLLALARASITDPELFPEVNAKVLQALTHPNEPERLTPRLVNLIWITEWTNRYKAEESLRFKRQVLVHLFEVCQMNTICPTMTTRDLHDALNQKRQQKNAGFIPQLSCSDLTADKQPPYAFIFAQIHLDQHPSIFRQISRLVDKKYDVSGMRYQNVGGEFSERVAQKYAEMLTQQGMK